MDIDQLRQLTQKYLDGTATPEEKTLLDQWYYSFEGRDIEIPAGRDGGRRHGKRIKKALQARLFARPSRSMYYVAAAALIILLSAAGFLFFRPAMQQATTTMAQQMNTSLPDGTQVWMNAASSLETVTKRHVRLTGEAYFDVAHDSLHPFVIEAGNTRITVLGTAFNVKAYAGKPVVVTVMRGKVKVEEKQHVGYVTPNRQIVSGDTVWLQKEVKASLFNSWKDGDLDFTDESFADIALTLERQFNIRVLFAGNGLGQLRFTASFDKGTTADKILDMLSAINQTGWHRNPGGTIIIDPSP